MIWSLNIKVSSLLSQTSTWDDTHILLLWPVYFKQTSVLNWFFSKKCLRFTIRLWERVLTRSLMRLPLEDLFSINFQNSSQTITKATPNTPNQSQPRELFLHILIDSFSTRYSLLLNGAVIVSKTFSSLFVILSPT